MIASARVFSGSYWNLLTLSWRRPLSYRSQSIDLLGKSLDWFLYDNGLGHERVNVRMYSMDALRKNEGDYFLSNQTMNCQTGTFLLKKIASSVLICNQFCL